ncbi:DUF397 domain-containing protein [Streptomyces sp. NPDC092296]|uniref:DUF397 domain-containing protein n=1 Tax=Streptomyces sp. NPDC092296 TaxID=3366012 RepID=UPI0038085E31
MTTDSPHWFKSSYSDNGGACVEVATNLTTTHDLVSLRDSKDPSGPTLNFPTHSFTSFITSIKAGEFGTL